MAGGSVAYVADELGRTSRDTRKASFRSLFALAALTVIAIGAVAAGLVAKNDTFWAGASIVFYTSLAAVIAYAATKLGVVSSTAFLLRAALKGDDSAPERTEPTQASRAASNAGRDAFVLARRFEEEGQLAEAGHAYLMATNENGNPEALYGLGQRYVKQKQYEEGELWLLKAAGKGYWRAAYLLGCLHRIHGQTINDKIYREIAGGIMVAAYVVGRNDLVRNDKFLAEYAIVPSEAGASREVLKDLADALPDYVEFWQAYFARLLRDKGADSALIAIDKAAEEHPDNAGLRLLGIRLDSSRAYRTHTSHFPEYMHPELNFHVAIRLINSYIGTANRGIDRELREVISKAGDHEERASWRSQLLAIEAAYEYSLKNDQRAGELLEDALALKPNLAEPLSSVDVQSLALILRYSDDPTAGPLIRELRERPKLKDALSADFDTDSEYRPSRMPVFKALLSSMVPGIDIGDPVAGSPVFSVAEIPQLADTARKGARTEAELAQARRKPKGD